MVTETPTTDRKPITIQKVIAVLKRGGLSCRRGAYSGVSCRFDKGYGLNPDRVIVAAKKGEFEIAKAREILKKEGYTLGTYMDSSWHITVEASR